MIDRSKALVQKVLPTRLYELARAVKNWGYAGHARQWATTASILLNSHSRISLSDRLRVTGQARRITRGVQCASSEDEALAFMQAILALPPGEPGVVVEAGCYKGGATAKFSLAAKLAGRQLVVFDSFRGIPDNTEEHDRNIFGGHARFAEGDYCGSLAEVRANVSRYGAVESCRFVEGWFEDTLPHFKEPISAIYLDVDLVSSTRTCLKYLYPLLEPGGILLSQDGHLPLVIELLDDDRFWLDELHCPKPKIHGLRKKRLVRIVKPLP
jgi:O-methyltransferase